MIYLYVKTHQKTGLKYFGKTTKSDPHSYTGSGKYWLRHLKVHGEDFDTEVVGSFTDPVECEEFALNFSKEHSIVESDQWANLQNENGLDGAPTGNFVSQETKDKISKSLIGKPSPKSKIVITESMRKIGERARELNSGTVWINDGKISKRSKTIPEGWSLGRLGNIGDLSLGKRNSSGNNTRGRKIYNNGSRHAYFRPGEEPNGWVSGKMEGYQGGTGTMRKGKKYGK